MAQQGSGLGKGPDEGAFSDQTTYNARNGAEKRTQKSFEIHPGMTDNQRAMVGLSPADPGTGPDASSPNPLANSPRSSGPVPASWDMKDANGKGPDHSIGGKVLGEAILSGSAKLPESESYSDAGPVRKP